MSSVKRPWYPEREPIAGTDGLISKGWNQYLRQIPQFVDADTNITGVVDGVNATFTLSTSPNPSASLKVRVRAAAATSWTVARIASISGNSFTLSAAPAVGSVLECDYRTILLS